MIEIRNIKLPVTEEANELKKKIAKLLRTNDTFEYEILKRSIDARKKSEILYVYQVGVTFENDKIEKRVLDKVNNNNVMSTNRGKYQLPQYEKEKNLMKHHPLIIGSGPAGLFCALILAKCGCEPIIVERGKCVEERVEVVNNYWNGKALDPECNVQFGEGGAGTFSDGKLNTQVKDKYGRIRYVLEEFVKHGANPEILYDNKPHIGTDVLVGVVSGIRKEIEELGGCFLFDTKLDNIIIENVYGNLCVTKAKLIKNCNETWVDVDKIILAIGHSARDTFSMLYDKEVSMTAKDFAMGVRIEHPQEIIRKAMYGEGKAAEFLPTPPYKLTYNTKSGRGVYSFCMCPGGYVVNASSEDGLTAVNGMSYSGRNGANSNSALIVTVRKEDFGSDSALAGVELQRKLERAVYEQGHGKIVVSKYGDFEKGVATTNLGKVTPQTKGEFVCGNVAACLPDYIKDSIIEAMPSFDKDIPGFYDEDAIISGVESRTSSPVRILRGSDFQSENVAGLYPCGEGAGYAGGIMSAALDGMKVAEAILANN
ncbi:MAG: FAD-dependent oxidoreductase [Lachnospiraceae bacterium]|jgi:hypothetical protein|nr:FAD-dependent oxidoreductase [Lachnospiraceae bacterium]